VKPLSDAERRELCDEVRRLAFRAADLRRRRQHDKADRLSERIAVRADRLRADRELTGERWGLRPPPRPRPYRRREQQSLHGSV
jgi:hypothetical protein